MLKMSDFGIWIFLYATQERNVASRVFVFENRRYRLKVLKFSDDNFDSGTAPNGEFRLVPKTSDFETSNGPLRRNEFHSIRSSRPSDG